VPPCGRAVSLLYVAELPLRALASPGVNTYPDTVFSVPSPDGETVLTVALNLDVPEPDLAPVENLLTAPMLEHLAQGALAAEQPYRWAAEHVAHAIEHLKAGEFTHAWPPLVTGIEGLFWAEAEQRGSSTPTGGSRRPVRRRRRPAAQRDRHLCRSRRERARAALPVPARLRGRGQRLPPRLS